MTEYDAWAGVEVGLRARFPQPGAAPDPFQAAQAIVARQRESEMQVREQAVGQSATHSEETQMPDGRSAATVTAIHSNGHHPPADDDGDVWDSTSELQHIRDAARARMMAPAAVLGAVLARRLAEVPPNVQLPPVIGDAQSLNFYTLAYGPPGSGKSASDSIAAELIGPAGVGWVPLPASGEKLAGTFVTPDADGEHGVRFVRRCVYLAWDEVTSLKAQAGRSGSTLLPTLLSAWPGKGIGTATQTRERNTAVPPHTYRLCAFLGVQVDNSDALLDGVGSGLPQRFLWMSTLDPDAPPPTYGDATVEPLRLADVFGRYNDVDHLAPVRQVEVCRAARVAIIDARDEARRGTADAAAGHLLLLREKVACGLSLLRPGCDLPVVDDAAWVLAGRVIRELHAPTYRRAVKDREGRDVAVVRRQGRMDEERENSAATSAVERVAKVLQRRMTDAGMTATEINRAVAGRDKSRGLHDEAVAWLTETRRWRCDGAPDADGTRWYGSEQ